MKAGEIAVGQREHVVNDARDATRSMRPVAAAWDHVRGGPPGPDVTELVLYGDYLCPYCRRLRHVLRALRERLGARMAYVFRHFPNEHAHPGATFASRAAEAAGLQDRFWEMHDALYAREPPLGQDEVLAIVRTLDLNEEKFAGDLTREDITAHIEDDLADGQRAGAMGTPTVFIDGVRYDGAWDYFSMLEALERPLGARMQRAAQAFANLPASAALILLLGAAMGLICANTPLAPLYRALIDTRIGLTAPSGAFVLTVGAWASEGLLTFFFLVVGLEIRREMTTGALADRRAAVLPALAACGGVIAPALLYLLVNPGAPASSGWSVPTATDVAFALGILALLGARVPAGLTVFVAALAVVDDVLSVLTLAIFYPHAFQAPWLLASAAAIGAMFALNRWRIYAGWPYVILSVLLWSSLHAAGVHAALAGIVLAAFIPTRPAPNAGALLAQAATALDALEDVDDRSEADSPRWREGIWNWARLNLAAASERLLSPAERAEQSIAPWAAFVALPLFAFSATGVDLGVDFSDPTTGRIVAGVVLGLVVGKPAGILLVSLLAIKIKIGQMPAGIPLRLFIGGACLCGVGDTVSLLLADQAFTGANAQAAKLGVLTGSLMAACIGAVVIVTASPSRVR
jgi:NhaA family Na+:H+ antiporter